MYSILEFLQGVRVRPHGRLGRHDRCGENFINPSMTRVLQVEEGKARGKCQGRKRVFLLSDNG